MGARTGARWLAAGVLLAAGACGTVPADGVGVEAQAPQGVAQPWPGGSNVLMGEVWWSWESSAALAPTGIEVVARSPGEEFVVGSDGAVWVRGDWFVARVDPESGSARVWDVSDDLLFGSVTAMSPAPGGGVWLFAGDRLVLFDGVLFRRVLEVPAPYRGDDDGGIDEVLQVGSEVWVTGGEGLVARRVQDRWSTVPQGRFSALHSLTVDARGRVWALAARTGQPSSAESGFWPVRFSGTRWEVPDPVDVPSSVEEIVPDPTGGVLVRVGRAVGRYDGADWTWLPGAEDEGWPWRRPATRMAVSADGVPWLVGPRLSDETSEGLSWGPHEVLRHDGSAWQTVAVLDRGPVTEVAAVGEGLLLLTSSGLMRLVAGELVPVWVDDLALGDAWPRWEWGEPAVPVAAVDAGEAWLGTSGSLVHVRDGHPGRVPLTGGEPHDVDLHHVVLASDGAVWVATTDRLVRITDSEQMVVPGVVVLSTAFAGPDGSLWVDPSAWGWETHCRESGAEADEVELRALWHVHVDGSFAVVPLPPGVWSLASVAAGAGGDVWVTSCYCCAAYRDCPRPPDLVRWDGQWTPVSYPGDWLRVLAVDAQGGLWAELRRGQSVAEEAVLAHYVDGSWTTADGTAYAEGSLGALAPDGTYCWVDAEPVDAEMVCVTRPGTATRTPIGVSGALSIAPDGSVWVSGGGVARLPVRVPG